MEKEFERKLDKPGPVDQSFPDLHNNKVGRDIMDAPYVQQWSRKSLASRPLQ
jgi:hypothetical protein